MKPPNVPGGESLTGALERDAAEVRPDFDAVMRRVTGGAEHDEAWLEDVLEPQLDLGEPPEEIVEACMVLRGRVEAAVGRRLEQPCVPPEFSQARSRVWMIASVAAVMAAAVWLALWVRPDMLRRRAEGSGAGLAVDEARPGGATGRVSKGEPAQATTSRQRRPQTEHPPSDPAPDLAPAEVVPEKNVDGTADTPSLDAAPEVAIKPTAPRSRRSLDERLEALDARAQQRWGAGDLAGAQRDFRKIVAQGGRRKRVQLAYAELFALARQRGQDLSGLWREYLRKFPKGRYAQDASAGLCRAKAPAERSTCWDEHRERFADKARGGAE